ncbi:MAG: antitoxin [Mycobacteriaceae bacterium]
MGFLDKAKSAVTKAVDEHPDKIQKGADKLEDAINKKTGNKHSEQTAQAKKKLEEGLDSLDGKNDDLR